MEQDVALIGYMRVSTAEQNTDGQRDALLAAGVQDDAKHLFMDHGVSGAKASRPGLDKCLESLREGDTLVVAKLDRLGRSLGNLVQLFQDLAEQGVGVRVLDNPILSTDGNNAQSKLLLGIYGAFAEYERDLLRDRTNVGLAAARARGRNGGRPALLDSPKIARAKELHAAGVLSPKEIADAVGVSVATLYRYLAKAGA
jgi:DNA invertase Pin-like site-specific DNA recombinase